MKKGSLHNEETPFSHEREALLDRKEYFGGIHPLLRLPKVKSKDFPRKVYIPL